MRDSQIHGFAVSLSKVITHLTHVDSHKGAPPCRAAMPANLHKVAGTQDTHPASMQPADVDSSSLHLRAGNHEGQQNTDDDTDDDMRRGVLKS